MPEISTYLKNRSDKKSSKKSEWDISGLISQPKLPTLPQRRPGRGDDAPVSAETPAEKLSQSEAKVEPNISQSEAKVEPNRLNHSRPAMLAMKKVEPELRPQPEPKLSQSEAKVEPNHHLSALVGLQRNILSYVYVSCRNAGSKTSAPVSIENLANTSKTTMGAARKAAQRLEKKGFIVRSHYKDGRGGWTQYTLPDTVYNAMLLDETRAKVEPNLGQTRAKVEPQLEPQLRPSASSSSSSILEETLKTTTSETDLFENTPTQLAPEWQQLDISPLDSVGFTQTHLIQIIRQGKLSVSEVQDSINFYAYDLTRNGLKPKSALNYFMGVVRRGIPYGPPDNYESPADEVRRKTLEFKERKAATRRAEEQKLLELEFQEWRRGLTSDDVLAIVPEFARRPGQVQESSLLSHFEKQIWPEISAKMNGMTADREQIQREIEQSLAGEGG